MPIRNVNSNNQNCTIIILSYNTKDITDTCLRKAKAAAAYSKKILGNEITIVVVDNNSQDGSCEMIKKKYSDVHSMFLAENVGCSRGNNLAMVEVSTPFILLLNSDAYLNKDTLEKSLEYMANNQSCDVLCVRQIYRDGRFQPFGGSLPTPWRTIFWTLGIESLPVIKHFIHPIYQYTPSFFDKEQHMEWCSTAFFMLRKKVYEKTGGFDESLFLFVEDMEWCKRIKDNHFAICYTPSISIVHLGGSTSKKLSQIVLLERHTEGMLYFHKVHYPRSLRCISRFLFAGMMLRAAFYAVIGKNEKAKAYKKIMEKALDLK